MVLKLPCKTFFFNNFVLNVFFLFVTAIISLLVTILAVSILFKDMKVKTLVTSLAFCLHIRLPIRFPDMQA